MCNFFVKNKYNILIILLWFFIVLIAAFYHEIWNDEVAHFYFLKTRSFSQMISIIQNYHGHPCIWYILLFPFVKLNSSPCIVQFISFIFMFFAVCYFCFKSPFNFFFKTLLIFSSAMTYYLPVVARSYGVIPLFLFILADLYPRRHERPILFTFVIIILSQIHMYLWGFCIICSALFLFEEYMELLKGFETKKLINPIISSILILGNFISLFYFFKGIIGNRFNTNFNYDILKEFLMVVPKNLEITGLFLILFFIAIIILFLHFFIFDKKLFFIQILSIFYINYIFTNIYYPVGVPYQKVYVTILIILFCLWAFEKTTIKKSIIKNIAIYTLLIILFIKPFFLNLIIEEKNNYFSSLPKLGKILKDKINQQNQALFVGPMSIEFYIPTLLYLNNEFLNFLHADMGSKIDNEVINDYINNNNSEIKYIVIPKDYNPSLTYPYVEIFEAPENKIKIIKRDWFIEDNYILYEKN